jgi:hypothetical protein
MSELPLLRETLEKPEARLIEGSWYAGRATTKWHLKSRHPIVHVVYFEVNTRWCCRSVLAESRRPLLFGIPYPQVSIQLSHDADDLPMREPLAGVGFGATFHSLSTGWLPQPIERLRAWLSAAEEYLSQERQILADLGEWAAEAALLDYRKPSHADRIARAVPAQRRAMERLNEASDAYAPVYEDIEDARGGAPASLDDPSELLLRWANQRVWLAVNNGHRIHVYHVDALPDRPISKYWDASEVDYMGDPHQLVDLPDLGRAHMTPEASEETLEVVWDQASIERCDRELAELWKDLDAEHDLPSDFASLWKAFYGYDFEAAYGRNGRGTRSWGTQPPPTTSTWSGSGGVGGCGGV